jgi:hypothetical protein
MLAVKYLKILGKFLTNIDLIAARNQFELDVQNMRSSLFSQEVAEVEQVLEKNWRGQLDTLKDSLNGKINFWREKLKMKGK